MTKKPLNIEKERSRLEEMKAFEREAAEQGYLYVFGIDEAGRGPLCGPVAAGCVVLEPDTDIFYLNDSKKIPEERREALYDEIVEKALAWGCGLADAKRIDEINILNATYEAMGDAFNGCCRMLRKRLASAQEKQVLPSISQKNSMAPDGITMDSTSMIAFVDGNRAVPGLDMPQKTIVKGDARSVSVAAASILAKVTRDRLMRDYDIQFPQYGFAKHKGYGTKEHYEALRRYGPCEIHRLSFLKNLNA